MNWILGLKRLWVVYSAVVILLFAARFFEEARVFNALPPQNPASVAASWIVLNEFDQDIADMRALGKTDAEIDTAIAKTGFTAASFGERTQALPRSPYAPHFRLLKLSKQGFVFGYFPVGMDREVAKKLLGSREPKSVVTPPEFVILFEIAVGYMAICCLWIFGPLGLFWIAHWVWQGFKTSKTG
ncbi:hypothetical protein PN445_11055 [Dolichospermum circinale CS-537/11]|nr:hypothetical protein [Dolichospermum circinale]MDB9475146.1 hypothetical protein [Dolichospermum circinale CS-537/11]